jgi:uncharacterized membrane protein YtjA (UPF0391 family)
MLVWALLFLLITLAAAILGFGIAVATFAAVAKLIFYAAFVLFLVSLVGHLMRRV